MNEHYKIVFSGLCLGCGELGKIPEWDTAQAKNIGDHLKVNTMTCKCGSKRILPIIGASELLNKFLSLTDTLVALEKKCLWVEKQNEFLIERLDLTDKESKDLLKSCMMTEQEESDMQSRYRKHLTKEITSRYTIIEH